MTEDLDKSHQSISNGRADLFALLSKHTAARSFDKFTAEVNSSYQAKLIQTALAWLETAHYPLKLGQFLEVLELPSCSIPGRNPLETRKSTKDFLKTIESLITISPDGTVSLKESSLDECSVVLGELNWRHDRLANAHALVSYDCLHLICKSGSVHLNQSASMHTESDLLAYAKNSWPYHFNKAGRVDRPIPGNLQGLLFGLIRQFACDHPSTLTRLRDAQRILNAGAFFGIDSLICLALEMGVDNADSCCIQCPSAISLAAIGGHFDVIGKLVQKGFCTDGQKPCVIDDVLHSAMSASRYDVVSNLLAIGMDVNGETTGGLPLHIAAIEDKPMLVQLLLNHGADPSRKTEDDADTAIHAAAAAGNVQCLRYLLIHVSDGVWSHLEREDLATRKFASAIQPCEAPMSGPKTILSEPAAQVKDRFQRSSGRNDILDLRNAHGHTALHLAAFNGHLEAARSLVEFHVDVSVEDLLGRTPLQLAVENDQTPTIDFLLSCQMQPPNAIPLRQAVAYSHHESSLRYIERCDLRRGCSDTPSN